MKYEGDCDSSCRWSTWNSLRKPAKETGGIKDLRKTQNHPNYCMVEIGLNTQKRRPEETWCHSHSSEKLLIKTGVKNSWETKKHRKFSILILKRPMLSQWMLLSHYLGNFLIRLNSDTHTEIISLTNTQKKQKKN